MTWIFPFHAATNRCACALTYLFPLPLRSSCFSSLEFCSFDVEICVEAATGLELYVRGEIGCTKLN